MKHQHLTDNEMEKMILTSGVKEAGKYATGLREICPLCEGRMRYYIEFHSKLSELLVSSPGADLEHLAGKMSNNYYFKLVSYNPEFNYSFINSSDISLMAAAHKEDIDSGIKLLKVFFSAEKEVIIRVLKDTYSGQISLYVLSDDPDKSREVIIVILSKDETKLFIPTNEEGIAKMESEIDWDNVNIYISTPLIEFKADEWDNNMVEKRIDEFEITNYSNYYKLFGKYVTNLAMITYKNRDPIIKEVKNNRISLSTSDSKGVKGVKLFI